MRAQAATVRAVLAAGMLAGASAAQEVVVEEPPRRGIANLRRPDTQPPSPQVARPSGLETPFLTTQRDAPLGFTGPSSIAPTGPSGNSHFIPMEDRWRLGFPEWDRYDRQHPPGDSYPYTPGHWWDPFNQNVLKGDYPIIGQHTFLNITGTSATIFEARQFPIGTTPFESTSRPSSEEFFGSPNTIFYTQYFKLSGELSHGDVAFKPADWKIRITPVFNVNYLDTNELAVVNPNVQQGTQRARGFIALEEWFYEQKLADTSPYYDFVSLRAGSQFFNSDFRGFIFTDTNRALRLFGNRLSNRDQFNIAVFDQLEKDTNSELNTFRDRNQTIFLANYFRQDFLFPGYTAQLSFHYNNDQSQFFFDKNNGLVRPDAAGVFQPHELNVFYLGFASDGHIGRYNISSAFYWALGRDNLNPIANQEVSINAQMAALELSYDRDWARFRTSVFWASGDNNVNDTQARGFDAILDNPNFAGGEFSYWQRQSIRLFNVNLVQRQSLIPNLRSSKIQGQSNFVNPGLLLTNFGFDMDLTPQLKSVSNANLLWFDKTNVLEQFLFDDNINRFIGGDISTGLEYRPLLSNNIVITAGLATLIPGLGFRDIYNNLNDHVDPLVQGFVEVILTY